MINYEKYENAVQYIIYVLCMYVAEFYRQIFVD